MSPVLIDLKQKTAPQPAPPKRRRGRPSVAPEQRAKIVEAFVKAIRRHGLAGATVERVAKSLGISRTLIFHYFGDMKVLIRAVAEYIVKNSTRDLASALEGLPIGERRKALVDFFVAGAHFEHLRDVYVLADIYSLAGQDSGLAAMIAEMWQLQIGAIVDALVVCYSQASRAECEAVAYALACLAEQHWWLTCFGPGRRRAPAVRNAAEALLATLDDRPTAGKIQTRGK